MKKITLGMMCGLAVLFFNSVNAQNVWTQHNDQARTGWYPFETSLNTTTVNKNTFGLAFKHVTDDKVVSQPLVVLNVPIPSKGNKNVVYVTTLNNTIYAYDADVNVAPYWTQNFTGKIAPSPAPNCTGCRPAASSDIHPSLCFQIYPDFDGNMGIVGTPVIDTAARTMYFVTKIANTSEGIDNHSLGSSPPPFAEYTFTSTGFHQYLHAIDITTGLDRANSPIEIMPIINGTGDGQVPAGSGHIPFEPRRQFNRAGLVLNNGTIYIAFAAHCDFAPSHGWVISYDATSLMLKNAFITTPNDGRGGIWMSGTAPALDAAGNIYFSSGNAQNQTPPSSDIHLYNAPASDPANRGESVIKLAPDLTLSSYFTPWNYINLNDADLDFPMQVMLLPGTNLLMAGNKDDTIYVMDRTNLGGFDPNKNNVVQRVFVQNLASMHSSFAYFGGTTPFAYQYSENSPLRAYPVTAGGLGTAITNTSIPGPSGSSGGYLSVSSNGMDPASGVLWAYQAVNGCNANSTTCPGTLHAVNASNVKTELWNSDMVTADKVGSFNKMSCPTIALGKVYLASNINQLNVYGLKINTTCTTNVAPGNPVTALTTASGPASNVNDGNLTTSWTSNVHNVDSIYIDLQGSFDICKIAIVWVANGFGKDFDLKISNDKINWTTVSSVRGNTVTNTEFDGNVTARYVSMVGITAGPSGAYSIDEFQIFGTPSAACPAPTNLNASTGTVNTIFTTQIPPAPAAHDPGGGVELGVKFRSSVAGFITGVRFYKGTGSMNGTDIGQLYTNSGTLLATATFTETASGWQTVMFSSPIAITANTTYVAAYYDPTGWYAADDNGLATAITNGNLTALANGGVFTFSTTPTFPTTSGPSNYFVDPLFSTLVDPSTANLTWDANPGATQYLITYRPGNSVSSINRTSATNSINISALSCGIQYFFTVQSVCGATQSTISQASFASANCGTTTCDALLTRWLNLDLGDIGVAGSTCRNGTVYTLTGSGTDIGGTSDQFQYAFTFNDIADYDVSGRIVQQDVVAGSSNKIGIMARDSLSNTSRFAYVASVNNGASFIFEYRDVPGAAVTTVPIAGHALPYFVKISKSGTLYAAFTSPDGITWTQAGPTVDLHFGIDPTNVPHYGMAVTSANNAVLSTGKIDNFILAGSTPLPIKLLSFSAKDINNDHVLVSWSTSMEHLVDHYEIQRSADNTSFQTIAKVKAVGESETTQYYSTNDNNPSGGTNYYRLKELDKDGNFYFSPVVSVTFGKPEGLEMYPNPADNFTNIISQRYPIVEVKVSDITGKLLKDIVPAAGQTTVQLNTAELSKGVYIISVKTTSIIYRQKLFKQ